MSETKNIASRGGAMAVDWEQRVNFDRPRAHRLARTYCAASDGRSTARIEEGVIVTAAGPPIIRRSPASELLVTGRNYVRGADFVNGKLVRDELVV